MPIVELICENCGGTFRRPHWRKQRFCSPRCRYDADSLGDRWSLEYDRCQGCGTTERPHKARGYCWKCYDALPGVKEKRQATWRRYYYRNRRSFTASGVDEWDVNSVSPEKGGWLAGFTDGDGCFSLKAKIYSHRRAVTASVLWTARADNGQVLQEIIDILGLDDKSFTLRLRGHEKGNRRPCYSLRIGSIPYKGICPSTLIG